MPVPQGFVSIFFSTSYPYDFLLHPHFCFSASSPPPSFFLLSSYFFLFKGLDAILGQNRGSNSTSTTCPLKYENQFLLLCLSDNIFWREGGRKCLHLPGLLEIAARCWKEIQRWNRTCFSVSSLWSNAYWPYLRSLCRLRHPTSQPSNITSTISIARSHTQNGHCPEITVSSGGLTLTLSFWSLFFTPSFLHRGGHLKVQQAW